jgi:hypothetical protein
VVIVLAALGGLAAAGTFVRDTWFKAEDPRPDLRVAPDTPICPYINGVAHLDLENIGPSDAGPVTVTITDADDRRLVSQKTFAGAPSGGGIHMEFDTPACRDGECTETVLIDPLNKIDESNESNNAYLGVCPVPPS